MDIHTDLEMFPMLNSLKNKQLWEVTDDYFESFADRLMARIEEEEMNPEVQFSDIPKEYFDTFLEKMKDRLEEEMLFENAPILSKIPKMNAFKDIPENYFENLTEEIQFSLEKEELVASAPVLHAIPKKIAYTDIPANYFTQVSNRIQQKIEKKEEGKVAAKRILFFSTKYTKTWASLAAMIIFVMAATFLMNRSETLKMQPKELSFAHISNAELAAASEVVDDFDVTTLVEELQLNPEDAPDLEEISDEELSDYLKDIDMSDIN